MNMESTYYYENKSHNSFFGGQKSIFFFAILVSLAGCIVVPQPAYRPAPTPAPPSNYVPPPSNTVASQAGNQVNFQLFYDELSPYGSWIDYPSYGYVWIPLVDPGFVPYKTMGHWINTDAGWTWISDYNWGWAAFHYGRWGFDQLIRVVLGTRLPMGSGMGDLAQSKWILRMGPNDTRDGHGSKLLKWI